MSDKRSDKRSDIRKVGPCTAIVLLLAAMVLSFTPVADARSAGGELRATEALWEEGGGEPVDNVERWWGVMGAALCGAEARLIIRAPAIGMNPYALAAGIAACSLAALDIMTTK